MSEYCNSYKSYSFESNRGIVLLFTHHKLNLRMNYMNYTGTCLKHPTLRV